MSLDDAAILLLFVVVLLLIWWTALLPPLHHRRPTAIRISFTPRGARRFSWRRFWRYLVDITIQPGEVKAGTLVILDQFGNDMPGAAFDGQPSLSSSDTSVAVVNPGSTFNDLDVTGIADGVAQIVADGNSGGNALTSGRATVTVRVTPIATSIDIRF